MTEEKKRFNEHKKYVMYPGRWQPLHEGHLTIMKKTLEEGKNIWVAIRDTPISSSDPYTISQRFEMIKRAFGDLYGDRVIASVIPDIEGIRYGRGVGYFVEEIGVSKEIEEISATNIRAGKDQRVHQGVGNYINLLESTIWLTGLPCSGKTTIADRLKEELDNREGYIAHRQDGDVVRGKGKLNEDLGFSPEERTENLRRIAHVAKMFNHDKTTVISSFVSPTEEMRGMVRGIIGPEKFKLVYVKCPLEICEERDDKGMYAKARRGELPEFTGVSAPFESPKNPDVMVETDNQNLEECVSEILTKLGI